MGVRDRGWKPVIAGLKTAKAIDFALSADELANQTFVRFEFMKTPFMKKLLRCSAHLEIRRLHSDLNASGFAQGA
jgi:hypothetical protein